MQANKPDNNSENADTGADDTSKDTIIELNMLSYRMPPDLSVCTQRTSVNNWFQNASYTPGGSSGVVILNTGAFYVDGRDSMLVFDIVGARTGGTNPAAFLLGSAFNVIRRLTIQDRAGNELERVQYINRLNYLLLAHAQSSTFLNTMGVLFGYGQAGADQAPATGKRFFLPLRFISGLFDYNQMLPPQVMSGLRIEIEWESGLQAFSYTDATPYLFSYTVQNPRILTPVCQMSDSIARSINTSSATKGLEIYFRTWYTTPTTLSTGTASYNIETRKAVSRCFGALTSFYPILATDAAIQTSDSMSTLIYPMTSWQYRLGNLYFPQQPITNATGLPGAQKGSFETYWHSMEMLRKLKETQEPPAISPVTYGGSGADPAVLTWYATYVAYLERSQLMDLCGVPMNNSRILAFVADADPARLPAVPMQCLQWISYVKLLRVFMENTEVEE